MIAAHMPRRPLRWLVGTTAMVLVALLAPASPAQAVPTAPPVPPDTVLSDGNGQGAVTPADRDFVINVRLAGLWEVPAGNMAQSRSKNPKVRQIGKSISEQHLLLDKFAIETAAKLGVPLPNEPTVEQQAWLEEMRNAEGPQFDQIYTDRLRAAHGKIFPAIAAVRAGTRNDVMRRLAQQTNQFVMTHLTLLESSGLVDYGSLPAPPQPVAANAAPRLDGNMMYGAQSGNVNTTVILVVLAVALVAGVASTMRIFRTR